MSRPALIALRAASAVGLLLVATYYLLASIPFSYYHFLQFPHFWWLPPFIRFHPIVLIASVAAYIATLTKPAQYSNHEDTNDTKTHEAQVKDFFFVDVRALRAFVVAVLLKKVIRLRPASGSRERTTQS
jgi:hypothetical protein